MAISSYAFYIIQSIQHKVNAKRLSVPSIISAYDKYLKGYHMAQLPIRSLRLRSFTTQDLDRLTGERGELFYDSQSRTLRIYNGAGQAASVFSVGGGNTLVNATKTVTLDSSGNLNLPSGGDLRNSSGQGVFALLSNYVTGAALGSTLNSYVLQNTGATGNIFTNLIDSADSSAITVTPSVIFSSDVTVENDLRANGSRVVTIGSLQSVIAASADFADFKIRIAALLNN